MRVRRSSLFVAATAVITAACGDKVNLIQPTSSAGEINSVFVTPTTATISAGQTVVMTAAVNATTGLTPMVAWTTSASASASLSATSGTSVTVTGGSTASPGVSICATATATGANSVVNCATVVVQPAALIVPAVLQIASITVAGNLNFPVPTPPGVVAGQINVSVNLNPGTEKMDSVVVMVNNIPAGTQAFTSTQAAALRSAVDGGADQALQSTLVFSINTAAYATAGCATQIAPCGNPTFPNGSSTISAVGYGKQGTSPVTNSAALGVNLLFGNADGWIVTQALGAGSGVATSATGFVYSGGALASVSVAAVPVRFSGLAIASVNINFGTAFCDASGNAQRVQPMAAPVAPSRAWTATFARTAGGAAHVADVNNYEFSAAACTAANGAGGEGAAIATALYSNNATAPTGFAPGSAVPVVRLDNKAPVAPSLMQNPRSRRNGWINQSVGLNALNTGTAATADNVVVAGAPDGGVGGTTAWVRVAEPGAGNFVDPVLTATALNTTTVGTGILAPTVGNKSLCGVWTSRDALGNESALPSAGTTCSAPAVASNTSLAQAHMLFGVDTIAPTIAFSGGLPANARIKTATVGTEFQVTVNDTGVVGTSGMLSGASVIGTVVIHKSNTSANVCFVGTGSSCAATSVNAAPAYPLVATSTVAASSTFGYYLYTASSQDAAGNLSAPVSRLIAYNPPANVPILTSAVFSSPIVGPPQVFNANAASNFDLWNATYSLTYAGGLAGPLYYPPAVIDSFPTTANVASFPLINSNAAAGIVFFSFIRQIENVTVNAPVTVGGQFKPTLLQGIAHDQANNASATASTPIPGASVTAGISYLNAVTYPAPLRINSWSVTNIANSVSTGAGPADPLNPLSIVLVADVSGPTATFNPPFTSVAFYVQVGANLEQIGSTDNYATSDDLTPMGRTHEFIVSWTPGTTSPVTGTPWTLGAQNLYAIGVNARGDALVTPLNANITLTNP